MVAIELEFNPEEQANRRTCRHDVIARFLKRNARAFRCCGLADFKAVHHTDVISVQRHEFL